MDKSRIIHEISLGSILRIIGVFLAIYLVYLMKDIVFLLIAVLIFTTALEPVVARLAKIGIPRAFSILICYLFILIVLSFALYLIVPPVAIQLKELALNVPYYSEKISQFNETNASQIQSLLSQFGSKLSNYGGDAISALFSFFGGVVSAVTIFVLTFYVLVDENGIRKTLLNLIPPERKEATLKISNKIGTKIGLWLRGQLSLMVIMGIANGLVYYFMGVPYALTIAIIAGILEIIPIIGPVVAAIIGVIVAFVAGVVIWKILIIIGLLILISQLENSILVPKIMQKAVGISPFFVILALLIGNKLLGIPGAILAIPLAAGLQVLFQEYNRIRV